MDPLKIINDIINITGPIISTSANISGQKNISPKTISGIPHKIRKKVDILLDLDQDLPGVSSTIIDVSGNKPVIIREGIVKIKDIDKLN